MPRDELDTALLAAHARGDGTEISGLYARAADQTPDPAAQAFFLTHAYIFALESGSPTAPTLRSRLVALGAER